MGIMIQIRNVPEPLHRTLKARAAMAGMSLSDYLLRIARQDAERPTPEEMRARLEAKPVFIADVDAATLIRAERDSR